MKKRIFGILMAIIMVASLVAGAVPALAAEDMITIRFHYTRPEGDYEGWEMWLWDLDGITALEPPYELTVQDDGTALCEFQVKTGTCKIGYIVRYGEWEKKDVDHDQFINITGVLSGTLDFYVESGKATQPNAQAIPAREDLEASGNLKLGDDVVTGVVITANQYKEANRDGKPEITLQLSSKLADDYVVDANTFVVGNSDVKIPVVDMRYAGQYVYLVLGETLDLGRGYNVTFEGRNYAVSMPDFYSNEKFEAEFTYTGDDLGATYTKEKTSLRVWAPTAVDVSVNLYRSGNPATEAAPYETVYMTKDVKGTWVATLEGDMEGIYYTYTVTTDTAVNEAPDPYGRSAGVNGKRTMIIDLAATNPEGWDKDTNPHAGENFTDAVIYELHVRDLSTDPNSGIKNVGKFLGLIERGTKTPGGKPTGLDHIVDLGVTHVHLLPIYDFGSVDETKLSDETANHFNWGYDPVSYNVPEGSYSTNPEDGHVRVVEMKQMVKGMHDAGLSVIMDVVYNHVYDSMGFSFNKIVPGYFSRPNSNGSGCGNDTASERVMVSKYIIDSVTYWANEYHIDGFRFDLVGLIDVNTINGLMESVKKTRDDVVFYGEGWTMGTSTTKKVDLCTQTNSAKVPGFAFFSDTIRNLIKGGTFGGINAGYISGGSASKAELTACFKGMPSWCKTPSQSINYISCHDNNTLYDHIVIVTPNATAEQRVAMNKLGAAFYMTAQGIPFFQAGEEILRTKPDPKSQTGFNENSYNGGDEMNSIKWADLDDPAYAAVNDYYKGLIAFRKAHPALRLTDGNSVNANVAEAATNGNKVVAYTIKGGMEGEKADNLFVVFNADNAASTVTLPEGNWNIYVNGQKAGTTVLGTASGSVNVEGLSAMVLVQEPDAPNPNPTPDPEPEPESKTWMIICGIVAALSVLTIAACIVIVTKKK